jgi:hypothetical protein
MGEGSPMRLTTSHLLVLVGLAAMACASLFAADNDWTWTVFAAYPLLLLARRGRPMARWFPVVLAMAVVALSAAGARDVAAGFVALVATLFILLVSPLLAWRRDWRTKGFHRPAVSVAALSIGLMISVVATSWPLHVAFLASRREFDIFARRLESGYVMQRPERVGRFIVNTAEIRDGHPCLWLGVDPAGFDGFVRIPPHAPGAFNIWTYLRLDDDWAFISED